MNIAISSAGANDTVAPAMPEPSLARVTRPASDAGWAGPSRLVRVALVAAEPAPLPAAVDRDEDVLLPPQAFHPTISATSATTIPMPSPMRARTGAS
jgi:hypothetical protein